MIEPQSIDGAEYEREWRLAVAARDAGRLDEAVVHLDSCMAIAGRNADEELEERVLCARASIAFLRGEGDEYIPRLCQIVLRNRSDVNGFLAANNVARACELRRDYRKGLFYGRIARERATALGRPQWVAAAINQIANLLLAESYFDQAAGLYREALALVPPEDSTRTGQATDSPRCSWAWPIRIARSHPNRTGNDSTGFQVRSNSHSPSWSRCRLRV